MQQLVNHIRRLADVNAQLSAAPDPLAPLLAEQAIRHVAQLSAAGAITQLQQELAAVQAAFQAGSSAAVAEFFAEPGSAFRRSVSRTIDEALGAGMLREGPAGLMAGFSPTHGSLATNAGTWLGQKLRDSPLNLAPDLLQAASVFLSHAVVNLDPVLTAFVQDVAQGGNPAALLHTAAAAYLDATQTRLAGLLNAAEQNWQKQGRDLDTVVTQLGAESAPPPLPAACQEWLAGASLLQTALRAAGADGAANEVASAVGYAQSAAQIYQCVGVLAAGASGWGAALAIAGLAGGVGGLGAFGGPSTAPGQAAVLQAIADLTQVIRSEFAKVNAKLDEILELLQHIVQEIRDMRWELKAVQEQVVQLDRKVNGLLIGVNDQFLQTASHALLQRHAVARTLARNRLFQPERMAEFRAFYAQAALEASQAPYILDLQSTELSRLGLAEAFSEGASGDVEQYKRQLLDVLANDFGLHLAGAPVFEPVLRIALEGYADVCLSDPAAFNMLDQMERDEQAETIRGVLFAHTSLMEDLRRQAAGGKGPGPVDHLLADYARQVSAFQDAWTVARTDAQVAYMAKVERGEWPDQRFASGPLYLGAAAQPGLQLLGDQYFGPGGPVANRFCTFIPQAAGEAPVHPLRLEIVNWVFGGRDPWSAGHQRYFGKITAHVRFHGTVIPGSQFEVNVLLWVQGPKILQAEQDLNDIMLLLSLADAPAGHTSGVEVLVNAFVATLSSGAAKDWVYQQQLYRLGAYPLGTQVLQAEEFLRQGPLHPCCTALTSMERTARAVRALTRIAYPDAYAASDPLHALFGPTPDTGMVGTALLAGWSTFVLELQRAPTAVLARTDPAALRWRAALLPGWQGPAAVPVALLPDLAARRSQYLAQVIGQVFAAGRQRGETFRFARAHRMFEAAIETVIGSGVNDSNVFSSTAVVRRLRRQTQTALARHRPGKPATPDAPPAPVRAAHV